MVQLVVQSVHYVHRDADVVPTSNWHEHTWVALVAAANRDHGISTVAVVHKLDAVRLLRAVCVKVWGSAARQHETKLQPLNASNSKCVHV